MVLDLALIEEGGNIQLVLDSQKKRFAKEDQVKECQEIYITWKKARGDLDTLNMNKNKIQKKIAERKKKDKTDKCEDLLKEKEENDKNIVNQQEKLKELEKHLNEKYSKVGNIVHESVPVADNEDKNEIVSSWGTPNKMKINGKPGSAHHHEVLKWIGGFDPERGSKIGGHKGYFLKGYGVLLNQALLQYGLSFLLKKNYEAMQTPLFMRQQALKATCQLSDFEESIYK